MAAAKVRRTGRWTQPLKRRFCDLIAEGASPTKASEALGLTRQSVYYQRGIDADFAASWEEALEQAADRYEDALDRLALKTHNVGAVIFALKNKRPGKWRDRHEVDVDSRNVTITAQLPAAAGEAMLARLIERHAASLRNATGEAPALPPGAESRGADAD